MSFEEFGMDAPLDHLAAIENDDLVYLVQAVEVVGNEQRRTALRRRQHIAHDRPPVIGV